MAIFLIKRWPRLLPRLGRNVRLSRCSGLIQKGKRLVELKEGNCMNENLEKVRLMAPDLRNSKEYPSSPRKTLGGYVLAARAVDKCRAVLAETGGEYHSNCPLDQIWLKFAEIKYEDFRAFVA